MQLRPAVVGDLDALDEIDGTIDSTRYLHVDRGGEGTVWSAKIDERPLRQKLIAPNPLSDETRFLAKQIITGNDDGTALVMELDGQPVALLLTQPDPVREVIRLLDVRVDFDRRREGFATAMLFDLIGKTREAGIRAVVAECKTNNFPAIELLGKVGFELTGLDTHRSSNHDLVKEAVTLFWYCETD